MLAPVPDALLSSREKNQAVTINSVEIVITVMKDFTVYPTVRVSRST